MLLRGLKITLFHTLPALPVALSATAPTYDDTSDTTQEQQECAMTHKDEDSSCIYPRNGIWVVEAQIRIVYFPQHLLNFRFSSPIPDNEKVILQTRYNIHLQ
jgi:hypothetical protein